MELLAAFALPCLAVALAAWIRFQPRFNLSLLPLVGLLVVLTSSVLGHEFYNVSIGPIPITLDRILLGFGGLLLIGGSWLGREQLRRLNRLDIIVIVLIMYLGFSTVTHDWRLLDNMPASRFLFFNFLPAALYFMMRSSRIRIVDLKLTAVALGIFGVYLAVIAVAEVKDIRAIIFPRYILNSEITEFFGRGRGPFLNPVSNGIFMTTSFCCVLMAWPRFRTPVYRVGILSLTAAILIGIYSTLTRSTWMGLVLACGWFIWMPAKRQHKGLMVVVATLVSIAAFPLIADKLFSFKRDKEVSVEEMAQSAKLRPMFAYVAYNMFQDRPIAGVGFGQYPKAKYPYLRDPHSGMPLSLTRGLMQHNIFLAYVTETGLIGLGLLLILLSQMMFMSWQIWRNRQLELLARQYGLLFLALLTSYIVNGMFHDVSIIPVIQVLVYFLAGVVNNIYTAPEVFVAEQASVPIVEFNQSRHTAAATSDSGGEAPEGTFPSAS